ncbi:MAG: NigD-like C-terminal domain-containing protein [Bacteroidales bacterium]|nr:hypothetical protein [Muribaculaceae bacterium]MDY6412728.1 NigD-like C-terminal domain-containing protein [Bacteroidales bacterium]
MRNAQLNIARHSTRTLALVIALLLVTTACDRSHDGNLDESFETQLTDLVTYTGLDSDNHAMFRLEGRDDAPAIDLFTTVGEPQKVDLHSRVLLRYSINHKDPAGKYWDINAMSLTRIMSDSMRVNINPLDTYSRHPIRLLSAWRTGEFINLHGQVEYTGKSRFLYMLVDRDTRMNDTVDAYLIHDLLGTPQDSVYYWREFYLSVNIGNLQKPQAPCHTISLHINDLNNPNVEHINFRIK